MNFGFDDQQELLRQEIRKLLEERCPMEEVRRIAGSESGHAPELWKQLGELGWLGLALPEEHGGAGLGWVDLAVVFEEAGRVLLPAPLVSTILAGAAIVDAGSDEQCRARLPALADGSRIGTLALFDAADQPIPSGVTLRAEADGQGFRLTGEKPYVADAGVADLFVVAFRSGKKAQEVGLALVDGEADGVSVETRAGIDATRRQGTLRLDGVRIAADALLGAPGDAWPAISRAFDRGAAAVTAEMIGAAEAMLEMTVQYAKDRIQFGSPIGRYQGVKHPLAEAFVDIECMKSLLYYTAWALEESPDEVSFSVSKAKGLASEAFTQIGISGIQLHGAIGYTEASDVHLYLRRSKWARTAFGDEVFHYDRVASLGGL
ncbi:MAG: acyl-CoA/acyl-ACP dehydrogenase [Deltaproteobacteria bacterium]|nr:acyl-CoA/acyl-ACP dehydrogenase [Deltaproteobacteria bacterium]MBW2383915.1 acyl-CoA/acyl-ACP dehydrogenase [Deltaproteobacteria bacterium]MBW2695825.1 acyl-CoA/acyl-ACP dehydrogenase [Deltaproteobacteria bacterium]